MAIEIKQLNIKSNVVQRQPGQADAAAAPGARAPQPLGAKRETCVPGGPQLGPDDKTLAQRKRVLRDAINQLQER
ncbi:DUF5908 family protein [Massilia scottii]|uniref:DUF5908 family protein n=1 Tax=Massilia scottii TaxID=3057166 RepID=UPI0027966270|nr:DUF5908 family protein [Massilia sp. CCM 9029]MDQ1829288.1 hypothetical protein [Massilia sp. CCM 9029]